MDPDFQFPAGKPCSLGEEYKGAFQAAEHGGGTTRETAFVDMQSFVVYGIDAMGQNPVCFLSQKKNDEAENQGHHPQGVAERPFLNRVEVGLR
jgi:hypothetical protein